MSFIFTLILSLHLTTVPFLSHFQPKNTLSFTKQYAKGYVYHDENENLSMDNNEIGIPDVYVSNGVEIVKTDNCLLYTSPSPRD